MMTPREIITSTFATGAFWANANGLNIRSVDLPHLTLSDQVVKDALRARSIAQVTDYAPAVFAAHGRAPNFDGEVGPAMEVMLQQPRCYVPDYAPPKGSAYTFDDLALQEVVERMQHDPVAPAWGDGNWRGCHDVGQYHSASVRVNQDGIGSHLKPVFTEVLKLVRDAYAGIGLLFHFIDNTSNRDMLNGDHWDGRINTEFSFVQRSNGWIGLAIVGQNQTCQSNIWCRYLATYRPSNVISEWTTLIKHELGHNCGMGHFSGRRNVMNPGIINGLPPEWSNADSSTPWLKRRFGGEPVPIDGPDDPDDPPPISIEQKVKRLEASVESLEARANDSAVRDAIQDASIQFLLSKVDQ